MLEGLGDGDLGRAAITRCASVKADSTPEGFCTCARKVPPRPGLPSFADLCKAADLVVAVGAQRKKPPEQSPQGTAGLNRRAKMAKRRHKRSFGFLPPSVGGALGDLSKILDAAKLKELAISGAAAGGAIVLGPWAAKKIPLDFLKGYGRPGALLAAGALVPHLPDLIGRFLPAARKFFPRDVLHMVSGVFFGIGGLGVYEAYTGNKSPVPLQGVVISQVEANQIRTRLAGLQASPMKGLQGVVINQGRQVMGISAPSGVHGLEQPRLPTAADFYAKA